MNGYAVAGTWLIVVAVILSAPAALVCCAIWRDEQRKDPAARIDLAPLYRSAADEAAWRAEFGEGER